MMDSLTFQNVYQNLQAQSQKKIAYVISKGLISESTKIPHLENRADMVHRLISCYEILNQENVLIIPSLPASEEDLYTFHSKVYIDYLKHVSEKYVSKEGGDYSFEDSPDSSLNDADYLTDCLKPSVGESDSSCFGIGYDCPAVDHLYTMVSELAGGTLTAARCLTKNLADIAINWTGGWHHATRDKADGFCYVNDIVIGIEELRRKFGKLLYIDLDIHHGNAVEAAYCFTPRVFTFSMHKYEVGFYPGSGDVHEVGCGRGKYYAANVPLKDGISDDAYTTVFKSIYEEIESAFKPNCIVMQCGADCISGDKIGDFNLTPNSIGKCVKLVLASSKPTLFLGGGGYNKANSARCWTYLTSIICGYAIDDDIPDNKYFEEYGPDFTLDVTPTYRKDNNSKEYLEKIVNTVIGNVRKIKDEESAPGSFSSQRESVRFNSFEEC